MVGGSLAGLLGSFAFDVATYEMSVLRHKRAIRLEYPELVGEDSVADSPSKRMASVIPRWSPIRPNVEGDEADLLSKEKVSLLARLRELERRERDYSAELEIVRQTRLAEAEAKAAEETATAA